MSDDRQTKPTLASKEDSAEPRQKAGRWPRNRERKAGLHITHVGNKNAHKGSERKQKTQKLCTLLDLCVSSLRRGHANLGLPWSLKVCTERRHAAAREVACDSQRISVRRSRLVVSRDLPWSLKVYRAKISACRRLTVGSPQMPAFVAAS